MYDEEFAKRIDLAVEKIGGIGKASALIGVSLPTITRWKEGVSDPKVSNMVAFANAAEVKLDWLLNGEGTPDNSPAPIEHKVSTNADADKYAYIPSFDMSASAGRGEHLKTWQVSKKLAFRHDWLLAKDLDPEQLSCIHVKGDSMEPTIPNDATILVDTRYTNALDGGISVLTIDNRIFVKRTQWQANGDLILISDNARYSDIVIAEDDLLANKVSVYGQVVHISYDLPH